MPSQLQVFLLSAYFESDGMMSYKYILAAKYNFKMAVFKVKFWASFEMIFFRTGSNLEALNSVSGKTKWVIPEKIL